MNLLLEKSACVSHWKIEAQRLLAHEICHSVIPQHTRSKSEGSSGRVDCNCGLGKPIGIEEVACGDQGESQLDGEEDPEVDDVQWSRSDEEKEVEDGPH